MVAYEKHWNKGAQLKKMAKEYFSFEITRSLLMECWTVPATSKRKAFDSRLPVLCIESGDNVKQSVYVYCKRQVHNGILSAVHVDMFERV